MGNLLLWLAIYIITYENSVQPYLYLSCLHDTPNSFCILCCVEPMIHNLWLYSVLNVYEMLLVLRGFVFHINLVTYERDVPRLEVYRIAIIHNSIGIL